jgi:hypothetical protein
MVSKVYDPLVAILAVLGSYVTGIEIARRPRCWRSLP